MGKWLVHSHGLNNNVKITNLTTMKAYFLKKEDATELQEKLAKVLWEIKLDEE